MPMVYDVALTSEANVATNGSANTENETFFVKAGVRNAAIQAVYMIGKGAGLTAISGIVMRMVRWTTASTSGVSITGSPKDPGMQAAKFTAASAPTLGSTRLNRVLFGCGAAGPGGWVAPNPDSVLLLEGGGAMSHDGINASGTTSLNFEWSCEVVE